ncbi:hypothetical protein DMUE_5466, partial [Dictyocoela muelleri]
ISNKTNIDFENKKDISYILKENENNYNNLELKDMLNETNLNYMVDTGSTRNFLRGDLVKKLNLYISEDNPEKTIFANNESVICDETILSNVRLGPIKKIFTVRFCILERLPVDAILGK